MAGRPLSYPWYTTPEGGSFTVPLSRFPYRKPWQVRNTFWNMCKYHSRNGIRWRVKRDGDTLVCTRVMA